MIDIDRRRLLGSLAAMTVYADISSDLNRGAKPEFPGSNRTALVALDSRSRAPIEPDWADLIQALRCCHDRIIGHLHIEQRGFHHWREWVIQGPDGDAYFEHIFSKPASLCDAVVVTSPSLIETDVNLSARESTETLVVQLMQRLGIALLDTDTLNQIAPNGQTTIERKPRAFALASATSTVQWPEVQLRDLGRQRELVVGSFGKLLSRPLLIATRADEPSAERIRDQLRRTDFVVLKPATSDPVQSDDPLDPVQLLALWPFEAVAAPPSSG